MAKDTRYTAFLLLLLISLMTVNPASAGPKWEFITNPPENQHDYHASDSDTRRKVKTVEKHHWDEAHECWSNGNISCAADHFNFMVRWVPNHPRALLEYSKLAIENGHADVVTRFIEYAHRFRPDTYSTYMVHGIHLYRMKQYDAAAEKFRTAIELSSRPAEAHYNLGLTYFAQEKFAAAREQAHKAYALDYPLGGLRNKLERVGAWAPDGSGGD